MYIPFEQMSPASKIWIYQADRIISENEQQEMTGHLIPFIEDWTSHNNTLNASFTFKYNYFLIIAVDNTYSIASGCSIDQSVQFIKFLGKKYAIDFFNRLNILTYSNGSLLMYDYSILKEKITNSDLPSDFKIFNNLIELKSSLDDYWLINIENSWLSPESKKQQ